MTLRPLLLVPFLLLACGEPREQPPEDLTSGADPVLDWLAVQDTTRRVGSVTGFAGPEAVRYDPEQDVYFVANFNGGGNERDANGFISRVGPDGTLIALEFMTGTAEHPLHAPRGMYLSGDTLWVADIDGLHGFDRQSGNHLAFVDFSTLAPGFLNDVAAGPDGAIYVTDTGLSRIYRMQGEAVTIAVEDTLLGPPNGITWDTDRERMLLAPWGSPTFRAWRPGDTTLEDVATSAANGRFDGIEVVGGRILAASQSDSSIHVLEDGGSRAIIHLPGRPADIGIDTRRLRVAVPYIALNRVDIWDLPK